jgi:lipopolysaccharide transport system permease protein
MTSAAARIFDLRSYVQALLELLTLLRERRPLVLEMARRQITTEHSGKTFGAVWGVLQPLLLFAVYAFVYGTVFNAKIGGTFEQPRDFTVYFLVGLVPWLTFLFVMAKAGGLIPGNVVLVKQVVFDLRLLPIALTLANLLPLLVGLGFIATYTLVVYEALPPSYVALPALVALQFLAMLGAAFVLSAIGAFFRDIGDFVQIAGVILIFLLPIVYLPSTIPDPFRPLLYLNPFSYMVWCYQDALYYGRVEHPAAWFVFAAWSGVLFVGGYRLFRRLRPHFGNVL